jgi:hypothetical protein
MDTFDTSFTRNVSQEASLLVETQEGNGFGVVYIESPTERFRGVVGPLVKFTSAIVAPPFSFSRCFLACFLASLIW